MNDDAKVPMIHFDGAMLPAEMRLAAWSRLTPGYHVEAGAGFRLDRPILDSRAWLLGDLAVTASRVSPLRINRTQAHILADGRDSYSFILLKEGGWRGVTDSVEMQIGSGQVAIMDFAQTWHVEGTAQDNVMLVVPRYVAAAAAPGAPPLHGRTLDGAAGRLLAEHLVALARHLPEMNVREIEVVRDATMALVSVALKALPPVPRPAVQGRQREMIARVRAIIEDKLTEPDLSVDTICREAAVTRSTLYRAFVASRGVASYIQRRRLEAAHARISDATDAIRMAAIAELFQFSSQAHFSTAFRRQFGHSPRQARGSISPNADVSTIFDAWRQVIDSA